MKSRLLFVFAMFITVCSNAALTPTYAAGGTFVTITSFNNPIACQTFQYNFDITIASGETIAQVNRVITDLNTGNSSSGFFNIGQTGPFTGSFGSVPKPDPVGTHRGDVLQLTLSWGGITPGSTSITFPCSHEAVCPMFTDGRLNDCDPGQTFALYCEPNGSLTVYAIYKGKGYKAFTISPKSIARVPERPLKNTLITQRLGARLYRLTSGQLQINRAEDGTGKEYKFTFGGCQVTNSADTSAPSDTSD